MSLKEAVSSYRGPAKYPVLLMFFALAAAAPAAPRAEEPSPDSYFRMSLEELMRADVTMGTLTPTKRRDIPASVTVITREDIAATPARNIADLIEAYVPGATFAAHQSNRIGIRGIISDRSYKLLLLVNGRNFNNYSNQGAVLELQNWDLHDIERIEIVRGPGSVTYGPGAIAGVVNIITKRKASSPGKSAGADYNAVYNSRGAHADYGFDSNGAGIYAYASYRATGGIARPYYFNINGATGASGYLGRDFSGSTELSPYYRDMLGPQLKLHLDVNLPEDWRLWTRYTNSGMPDILDGQGETLYGTELLPKRFESDRGFALFLENEHAVSGVLSLATHAGFTTQQQLQVLNSSASRNYNEGIYNYTPDKGNIHFGLAENTFSLESVAHFEFSELNSAAFGAGFSEQWLTSPYLFDIKLKSDRIAAGFQNSTAPDGASLQRVTGDGFSAWMGSIFGEWASRSPDQADIRLSARLDKNEYSPFLFSPRLAVVSELDENNILKFIWQRSVRMNTLLESYVNDYSGVNNKPETLDAYEFIYGFSPHKNVSVELPFFLYDLKAIGFDSGLSRTVRLGSLRFFGLEPEISWQTGNVKAGLSHSLLQQLRWRKGSRVSAGGISYADYNVSVGGISLQDQGNSINNFPEQATKVFASVKDLFWGLTAHADLQVFWNYQGKKDGLEMYENAYAAAGGNAAMDNLAAKLRRKDFGGLNTKLNCSLSRTYRSRKADYTFTAYGLNLLGFKRYVYDSGNTRAYPSKFSWVEEPASVGVNAEVKF